VSLKLIPHSKKEIAVDVKEKINGATNSGYTGKVSNYEAGMVAKASYPMSS
jgi:hypothetical protein